MSAETMHQHFRGVHCRRCGKPVRVPALVRQHETASHTEDPGGKMEYHLVSQTFVLRCRACQKESVYSINQIVDCALLPTTDLDRAKTAAA